MRLTTLITLCLVGTTLVQYVKCTSAIVVFFFPRLMFGRFHDALVESRDVISSHFGVVEVLSYKIIVHPDTLTTSQFNGRDNSHSICVISFDTKADALDWILKDPLVTRTNEWSQGHEVNVILVSLTLSRHYPFSLYRKAHVIAMLTPIQNSTGFASLVVPEVTRIYSKYGGNNLAMATTTWERVMGMTWPPNSTEWIFYGPVADIDSVKNLFLSDDMKEIESSFSSAQFYGIDSFFNTGSNLVDFRSWPLLFMCFANLVLHEKSYFHK